MTEPAPEAIPLERTQGALESAGRGVPQRLFWRAVVPPRPRAVLAFIHGLAEHSGRYLHVFEHFAAAGYACRGFDLRGHGESSGRRLDVSGFDEFHGDVDAFRTQVEEAHPGVPLVLVGHSMGALLALHHALERPRGIAGMMLSSPALAVNPGARPAWLLGTLIAVITRLAPRILVRSTIRDHLLSHSPEALESRLADPLIVRRMSPRWFAAFLATMEQVSGRAAALAVPTLMMQSGDDRLVDADASRRWAEAAPQGMVDFHLWDGLYHEMFNELEHDEVFRHMESWLEERKIPTS